MKKLLEGIVKFRQGDFKAHKELFMELKNGQNLHTLFISSDSRIDPNMITGTLPGEIFIYNKDSQEFLLANGRN